LLQRERERERERERRRAAIEGYIRARIPVVTLHNSYSRISRSMVFYPGASDANDGFYERKLIIRQPFIKNQYVLLSNA